MIRANTTRGTAATNGRACTTRGILVAEGVHPKVVD